MLYFYIHNILKLFQILLINTLSLLLLSSKACPTLGRAIHCSMLGLPVLMISPSLLKLMSIVSKVPSNNFMSVPLFPSCLHTFPSSVSLPVNQLFASGSQSIGVSASTTVLPINTKD